MQDLTITLTLKEIDHPDQRIRTREIDGSNFIMENGQMATTQAEREAELLYWIEERGEQQHNSRLELISFTVQEH